MVLRDASLSVPDRGNWPAVEALRSHRGYRRPHDEPWRVLRFISARSRARRIEGSYDLDQPRPGFENHHARAECRRDALLRIGSHPDAGQTPKGLLNLARVGTLPRRGLVRRVWLPKTSGFHTRWDGEPPLIKSASVSLNGKRVAVSRLQAKAGGIAFTGEYRWEPAPKGLKKQVPKKQDPIKSGPINSI